MEKQKWYGALPGSRLMIVTEAVTEHEARANLAREVKGPLALWLMTEWATGGAPLQSETSIKLENLSAEREKLRHELHMVECNIDRINKEISKLVPQPMDGPMTVGSVGPHTLHVHPPGRS